MRDDGTTPAERRPRPALAARLGRWAIRLAGLGALVFVTVLIGRGVQARGYPDLELWHRVALREDVTAADLNRVAGLTPFLRPSDATIVASLFAGRQRTYRVSLVTNAAPDTLEVVEQSLAAGETAITRQPTGMAWPEDVFSLSHVALPFPPDDPLYGRESGEATPHIRIGRFSARGERAVLLVPMDVLMRLSYNPFFAYMERRVGEWIDRRGRATAPSAP